MMAQSEIKFNLVITNTDDILAYAKRLDEISKELTAIAYKLQAKLGAKEEQPKVGA